MCCPKCGTQNPETGKFCRSCGTDLGNVSLALSGNLPKSEDSSWGGWGCETDSSSSPRELRRRSDSNEVYGDAVKSILSGIGFLIVAIVLLTTGVAGGHRWWWAMLFPAFTFLAKGVSDFLKHKKMAAASVTIRPGGPPALAQPQQSTFLPPQRTEFVSPESRYKTGDLVPASVTDNTTRHLEPNSEGETMTLPKS